jgi:formate dehydrogenase major subunit
MDNVKLRINGQDIEARPGQTILEVVREQRLDDIPTLCHSPELDPYGSCFVCVVELKGRAGLVPACATRIAQGMEVETRSERVLASRRTALELLLSNHYADCISPCKIGCPAGVDAQGYIALAAMGDARKAMDLIRESNPLPAVCGRVCVRKCEVVCRRADIDGAVGINAIKRYLTDSPGVYDGPVERLPDNGKTVGIVGAGPAGLTAAWFLGRLGYRPVLYEMMEKAGGMVRYGIPEYRLPDEVLDLEIDFILRAGAELKTSVKVGKDVGFEDLRKRHDAVFVAAGAWAGNPMKVDGEFETEGVVNGIDFLREKYYDRTPLKGTVVVVGGGNTAMDVARTAWRLNADKVIILYRRTKAEMPADPMEVEDALHESVELMELSAPVGILADDGRLKALRCIRMKLGEPDSSGRRRPVPLDGSEFDLPCQLAVSAIGQSPLLEGIAGGAGLPGTSRWGTVSIDTQTMKTDIEGVFAGGDTADDGPTVVIDAIADGRIAAQSIHSMLCGKPAVVPFIVRKDHWAKPGTAELGDIPESPRHEVHMRPIEEREGSFVEVATGFYPEDVTHEGARCLSCGCVRYDDCELRLRAGEYGVDMEHFRGYARKHKPDERHPYIVYDPNKCVLCSRCIRTCARVLPVSALGLVGRGFRTEMRPAMNDPLVETNCVSCGNCVDSCPTGALTAKFPYPGRACLEKEEGATRCSLCSLLCPVRVMSHGANRYYITSSGEPGQYLCRFGRFVNELYIKQKRVRTPWIRRKSGRCGVDICEAVRVAVAGLKAVAAKSGPASVAVFVSPELGSEEMMIAGLLAREGLGTANIASLSALCLGGEAGMLDPVIGFTASTAGRESLAEADVIVCNNTSLESDHPVLSVDVLEALRKRGSDLIVVNSMLDDADRNLSAAALDPMRGSATILWSGIIQKLVDSGCPGREKVESMPGGRAFLASLRYPLEEVCSESGVGMEAAGAAVELLRAASRVVVIHTPDRLQDKAPGDIETLANMVMLLRAAGVKADLLLPRILPNGASLEVSGADPAFGAGRMPSPALPGARTHSELRKLLADGSIHGALLVGEDPMRDERTAAWFRNVEFLAAMDWAETETIRAADVVLPGTTGLESDGTRCDLSGRPRAFTKTVEPPSGLQGWQILALLAAEAGVARSLDSVESIREALRGLVLSGHGTLGKMYTCAGDRPEWDGSGALAVVPVRGRTAALCPPLTAVGLYKARIREVGAGRFKVL